MNTSVVRGCLLLIGVGAIAAAGPSAAEDRSVDPTREAMAYVAGQHADPHDWPQWGGGPARNNVPAGAHIPTAWNVATGEGIKWSARLGSETYGNPVVAHGKVYIGTNNGAGYLERYPSKVDLGVLLCLEAATGQLLWQYSSEKLPTEPEHDWPNQGICCAPMVEGDRLWCVTNRGEVVCLDTAGFRDGENDGPLQDEPNENQDEADVIWKLDMMNQLGVWQHNMCSCSVTGAGDLLFVGTSNGVNESHVTVPNADAPSFICVRKSTGDVLWTDKSPGANILHGQWSSPAYGVLGGVPQVIFGGGDGWLYGFAAEGAGGQAQLLWEFDCNPKGSKYVLGGRATRNFIVATPVIYDGRVYVAVGDDPEYGEGAGHLWCVDPTKRGDVSPTIVYNVSDPQTPLPPKRFQALDAEAGDFERDNPNSALVWHYVGENPAEFEQAMHRTCGTVAIQDGLLLVADFSGLVHCLDANTGQAYWTHDMLAASWASPLIVDGKVYIGDEDGDVAIFKLARQCELLAEINLGSAVYTTPIVAGNVLYIANRTRLFAIERGASSAPAE